MKNIQNYIWKLGMPFGRGIAATAPSNRDVFCRAVTWSVNSWPCHSRRRWVPLLLLLPLPTFPSLFPSDHHTSFPRPPPPARAMASQLRSGCPTATEASARRPPCETHPTWPRARHASAWPRSAGAHRRDRRKRPWGRAAASQTPRRWDAHRGGAAWPGPPPPAAADHHRQLLYIIDH